MTVEGQGSEVFTVVGFRANRTLVDVAVLGRDQILCVPAAAVTLSPRLGPHLAYATVLSCPFRGCPWGLVTRRGFLEDPHALTLDEADQLCRGHLDTSHRPWTVESVRRMATSHVAPPGGDPNGGERVMVAPRVWIRVGPVDVYNDTDRHMPLVFRSVASPPA